MHGRADLPRSSLSSSAPISFMWLEITGKCNLRCVHCYADSGPDGSPDIVGVDRWRELLDEAAGLGVGSVQFIGGEPTLHPHFETLLLHAVRCGFAIEVYTNLTHVTPRLWDLFERYAIAIATSFYSASAATHDAVTARQGSQTRTLQNLRTAVERGLPVRVGVVDVASEQDAVQAVQLIRGLGIENVGRDHVRAVGRGRSAALAMPAPEDALCGACCDRRLAIDPSGTATPCVFARWLPVGSILTQTLAEIAGSAAFAAACHALTDSFRQRPQANDPIVEPETEPDAFPFPCGPGSCNPNCAPACMPSCNPNLNCGPNCFPW